MDTLTDFFKMLSDETRVRILVLLYHKKLCVCELCDIMNETQPKVSKHLAKLRDLGFIKDERQEQFIYYYLNLNNGLFQEILKNIVESIDEYEAIKKDIEKIEKYDKKINIRNI